MARVLIIGHQLSVISTNAQKKDSPKYLTLLGEYRKMSLNKQNKEIKDDY